MEKSFLEIHKDRMEMNFWSETYKSVIIKSIESTYITEVIREWYIADIIFSNDKVLINWNKRYRPLMDEELKEKYGRTE